MKAPRKLASLSMFSRKPEIEAAPDIEAAAQAAQAPDFINGEYDIHWLEKTFLAESV